jgi:hypothetical protein
VRHADKILAGAVAIGDRGYAQKHPDAATTVECMHPMAFLNSTVVGRAPAASFPFKTN